MTSARDLLGQLPPELQYQELLRQERQSERQEAARRNGDLLVAIAGALTLYFTAIPQGTQILEKYVAIPEITIWKHSSKAIAKPQSIFPISGKAYSEGLVTDRPGSPRSGGRVHAGVDLVDTKTPFKVVAVLEGQVNELNPDSSVGGVVSVKSKGGIELRYVHLDREYLRRFKAGQQVEAGQMLGVVSTTFPGSSGPHLHVELYRNGRLDWNVESFLKKAKTNAS